MYKGGIEPIGIRPFTPYKVNIPIMWHTKSIQFL